MSARIFSNLNSSFFNADRDAVPFNELYATFPLATRAVSETGLIANFPANAFLPVKGLKLIDTDNLFSCMCAAARRRRQ